ncbi:hypothetical protein NFI96_002258 [Prochilodus magdalenae]|nr:hypothetical protein NFI96_002258 [Prochilodus magdalenae]
MTAHHLKLNPNKTELLFIPSTTGPHCDLTISFWNSLITPTEDARSLGVILDGQLSFSAHITNLTWSYKFLLYTIRRIRPFLSQEATQLLSRLDYCNSLLAGLPLRAIRPLQLVQNAAARLIFNLPKFTHVTPLLRSIHWLPVVARIRSKTLMLAYKAKIGPAPPYLMAMVPALAPVWAVSELVIYTELPGVYLWPPSHMDPPKKCHPTPLLTHCQTGHAEGCCRQQIALHGVSRLCNVYDVLSVNLLSSVKSTGRQW